MDLVYWGFDVNADHETMTQLLSEMQKVNPSDDAKLTCLKELIQDKIENPINPGSRQIPIFTAFSDTAGYLYDKDGSIFRSTGPYTVAVF
jgi:ERCC4-related helicase